MQATDRMAGAVRRVQDVCLIAVIASAGLLAPASAEAQLDDTPPQLREKLKAPIDGRMMKRYGEKLRLSAAQKAAANQLLATYLDNFSERAARLKEVWQAIDGESKDRAYGLELHQGAQLTALLKYFKKADELSSAFMGSFRALLNAEQQSIFPAFERAIHRRSSVTIGFDDGHALNLSEIVEGLGLDAAGAASVASVLEQYEIEVDGVVAANNKFMQSYMQVLILAMQKENLREVTPIEAMIQAIELNESKLGTINDRYVRQVRPQLPESVQKRFDEEVRLKRYPQVYRKSFAMRTFEAAQKLTDLDAVQRDGIAALKESYVRESESANAKWAAVIDELRDGLDKSMELGEQKRRLQQKDEYKDAADARKALDKKAIESVLRLLNEEQKKKLPSPTRRPEFDFDPPPVAG